MSAGKHKHDFVGEKGHSSVYYNVDASAKGSLDGNQDKERAVKKVVRVIIEANGGDGATLKKEIETNYPRGTVLWKGERVAEWTEDKAIGLMKLMGYMVQHEKTFRAFFKTE